MDLKGNHQFTSTLNVFFYSSGGVRLHYVKKKMSLCGYFALWVFFLSKHGAYISHNTP